MEHITIRMHYLGNMNLSVSKYCHPTWELPEVSVEVLLMITIDGSCHPWPWPSDTIQTRHVAVNKFFALGRESGHYAQIHCLQCDINIKDIS